MNEVASRIRAHPLFRASIAAPIAIMLIFSLFNLTAAPDQERVPGSVTLAIVNLDEGLPDQPPLSEQLLAGLTGSIPASVRGFDDETTAVDALDDGDVSAVLVVPGGFSAAVMGEEPVRLRFVASQHLSRSEVQFTAGLARQIEGAISSAVAGIRLAAATGAFPPPEGAALPGPAAIVETDILHAANNAAAMSAPFVMTFATWLAAMVGALMIFLATRGEKDPAGLRPVGLLRSAIPLAVPALASLALAIVVAWTTDNWGDVFVLWLFVWLATSAIMLLMSGLFAVVGFFALLLAIPAVFYQSALSGTQAPIGATPDWLEAIADVLPFEALGTGYRSLVIGGGDGSLPVLLLLATGVVGLALIWLGTWAHMRLVATRGGAARA